MTRIDLELQAEKYKKGLIGLGAFMSAVEAYSSASNNGNAIVSRSAEYSDLFREANGAISSAYCQLGNGELNEWLDEVEEKIQIIRKLNNGS